MADQDRDYEDYDLRHSEQIGDKDQYGTADFTEETSAELAAPISYDRRISRTDERDRESVTAGKGVVIAALALSILSLFVLPILFDWNRSRINYCRDVYSAVFLKRRKIEPGIMPGSILID